jgi:peptidoglycan/xylan/chitin deacetylase (PgdA/CDA1 family)
VNLAQLSRNSVRNYVIALILILLVALPIAYANRNWTAKPATATVAQLSPTAVRTFTVSIPTVITPIATIAASISARPTLPPTVAPNIEEAYCLWPGDTLSQLSLNAHTEITTILALNPTYHGFAGNAIHLPVGSVPPSQWKQPAPALKRIKDLPFGASGYYIGADNRAKRVTLTFDIGFVPANKELMKMLADRGIQATFFVVGDSMSRHPDVINDILHYGHELGNHSWSHNIMHGMTEAQIVAELQKTEATVQAANPKATTKPFFRAPFGAINDTIVKVAQQEGYYVIGWTVDSRDWTTGITADKVYARVTQNVCPGAIIVMHDVNQANSPALPRILDYLVSHGYSFVPLSKMLTP